MSVVLGLVLLVVLWLLAWGEASLPNVVSGVLAVAVLLIAFPPDRLTGAGLRLRPGGVARLLGHILVQLVTSNLLVAREILSPRSRVREGVIAYDLQHPSDEVLTLMANVIALSPGTMTVEATRQPATIYVHFLLLHSVDDARREIARLEKRAVAAIGPPSPPAHGPPVPPAHSPPVPPAHSPPVPPQEPS